MKAGAPWLRLALLAVVCFSLATWLQPRALTWGNRAQADNLLKVVFGEGRRLFANHFFVQADVVFHSGYYPSIFDQVSRPAGSPMVNRHGDPDAHDEHEHDEHGNCKHDHGKPAAGAGASGHDESAHEREMAFLREPKDWIERFGRRFIITEHTHLAAGKEREILPWLRLSAELDPQRVETYTVAAYWLRTRLGKTQEAEQFLREGLRNNPDSYEILFELGRLYHEVHGDNTRARNVWDLALRKWAAAEAAQREPDLFQMEQIAVNLAWLEEEAGNYVRAINLLELGKKASPHPADLDKQITEIKTKLAAPRQP